MHELKKLVTVALIITVFGAMQKPCRHSQIRSKKNKGPMEMVMMMFIGIEAESERTLRLLTWTSEPPACGQDLAGRPALLRAAPLRCLIAVLHSTGRTPSDGASSRTHCPG